MRARRRGGESRRLSSEFRSTCRRDGVAAIADRELIPRRAHLENPVIGVMRTSSSLMQPTFLRFGARVCLAAGFAAGGACACEAVTDAAASTWRTG